MKKILIADDRRDQLLTMKIYLGKLDDVEIMTVSCVDDAIKEISKDGFDLVVTDVDFGGNRDKDGLKILIAARAHGMPVLVVTSVFTQAEIEKEFISEGASKILIKTTDTFQEDIQGSASELLK